MLSQLQARALARLHENFAIPNAAGDIMRRGARDQQFVFDDVVFNAIALFDYVGNTVGFAFYGEQRRKAKWDRIQNYARDAAYERRAHPSPRISGHAIAERILEAHAVFVSPLSDYRADLIHYETAPAGGGMTTQFAGGGVTFDLSITVPKPFAERFVVPGFELEPAKAPLPRAAEWVNEESHRYAEAILRELERDLRAESGRDPDGTDHVLTMA